MQIPSPQARADLQRQVDQCGERLGDVMSFLASRGITRETAERFQLGYDGQSRLTIPYRTPAGPVQIKRRCTYDHNCKEAGHPKYMYDAGAELHLFNASVLLRERAVFLVEGEIDAITLSQAGVAAVAYPGTAAWNANPHWRWCFDSTTDVIVVADGDEPGRKAAEAVTKSLTQAVDALVRIVEMPAGHDANSFITSFGEDEFFLAADWH